MSNPGSSDHASSSEEQQEEPIVYPVDSDTESNKSSDSVVVVDDGVENSPAVPFRRRLRPRPLRYSSGSSTNYVITLSDDDDNDVTVLENPGPAADPTSEEPVVIDVDSDSESTESKEGIFFAGVAPNSRAVGRRRSSSSSTDLFEGSADEPELAPNEDDIGVSEQSTVSAASMTDEEEHAPIEDDIGISEQSLVLAASMTDCEEHAPNEDSTEMSEQSTVPAASMADEEEHAPNEDDIGNSEQSTVPAASMKDGEDQAPNEDNTEMSQQSTVPAASTTDGEEHARIEDDIGNSEQSTAPEPAASMPEGEERTAAEPATSMGEWDEDAFLRNMVPQISPVSSEDTAYVPPCRSPPLRRRVTASLVMAASIRIQNRMKEEKERAAREKKEKQKALAAAHAAENNRKKTRLSGGFIPRKDYRECMYPSSSTPSTTEATRRSRQTNPTPARPLARSLSKEFSDSSGCSSPYTTVSSASTIPVVAEPLLLSQIKREVDEDATPEQSDESFGEALDFLQIKHEVAVEPGLSREAAMAYAHSGVASLRIHDQDDQGPSLQSSSAATATTPTMNKNKRKQDPTPSSSNGGDASCGSGGLECPLPNSNGWVAEDLWQVESVVAGKFELGHDGSERYMYRVKWRQWIAVHNSWVEERDFESRAPVMTFWRRFLKKVGQANQVKVKVPPVVDPPVDSYSFFY